MNLPKRVISVLLVLAWTIVSCEVVDQAENSNGQDNWQTYTSDNGGFSILFPSKPTLETTTSDSMDVHTALASKDNTFYRASFGDLPDYSMQDFSPDTILDTTVEQTVISIDGKLIYKKEISFQGHPGREFKIESSNLNAMVIQRVFLVNNTRLYTQNAATSLDNASNSNIVKFLDSFALTE
jgi:hypothetical protein